MEARPLHPRSGARWSWVSNVLLSALSLLVVVGAGEGLLRLFFSERLMIHEEERALLYRHDPKLGWFPRENSRTSFTGSRTITVAHNSRGFRDREHLLDGKPALLVLGDSFVWGYDVEAHERFTDKLQSRLPEWNVYNIGVSGYGTDQELLLLMDQFDYYRPKLVFLVFCSYNDEQDNESNSIGQGGYYKPYFTVNGQKLVPQGMPVPTSLTYFGRKHPSLARSYVVRLLIRAAAPRLVTVDNPTMAILRRMNQFVRQNGSLLAVGLEQPHPALEHFFQVEGVPYLRLDGAERYPSHGWHWTPAGHTAVSDAVYSFLLRQGVLAQKDDAR